MVFWQTALTSQLSKLVAHSSKSEREKDSKQEQFSVIFFGNERLLFFNNISGFKVKLRSHKFLESSYHKVLNFQVTLDGLASHPVGE